MLPIHIIGNFYQALIGLKIGNLYHAKMTDMYFYFNYRFRNNWHSNDPGLAFFI